MSPLTPFELTDYLQQRGLLAPYAIVDGQLRVIDASQRHCNLKVVVKDGPSYLVKQGIGPERTAMLRREASAYRRFEALGAGGALRPHIPRCHLFDSERDVLVLELLTGATDLRDWYGSRAGFPIAHARGLARILAATHSLPADPVTPAEQTSPLWGQAIYDPDASLLHEVSRANLRLVSLVQQHREFGELLTAAARDWQSTAFIHSDVRWANCLLARASRPGQRHVVLVDWELAGTGDPAWDVGCVLSEYLSWSIHAVPLVSRQAMRQLPVAAVPVLRSAQAAIRAFWASYTRALGVNSAAAEQILMRAARFCAIRLVQTAYEEMQLSLDLTATVTCQLQVSCNILQQPNRAVTDLFGLQHV